MRILVIRRDNIGDLVCTTPLFAALRARYPEAHLAALVNSYNAPVLDGNPDLNAVHSYTKLKHCLPHESRWRILMARFRMLATLRADAFDYVILAKAGPDPHGLSLARQLRARQIVGFVDEDHKPPAITIPVPPPDPSLHEVQALHLLAKPLDVKDAPGPLRIYPKRDLMEAWRRRLPEIAHGPIAVHISAREPDRRWATANWVEIIRRLTASSGRRVVLLWAPGRTDDPRHPGDDDAAAAIQGALASVMAARTDDLHQLIAVLAQCSAFVGPDGGAMHIAVALGLPTVALFENRLEKKARWYPWLVPHEMVFPAARDIRDITVDEVALSWNRLAIRLRRSA